MDVTEKKTSPAFAKDEQGRWIVPLSTPITVAHLTVTELRVKPMTAGALRMLPADRTMATQGHMLDVIAKLTGQPPVVIDELSLVDLATLSELLEGF